MFLVSSMVLGTASGTSQWPAAIRLGGIGDVDKRDRGVVDLPTQWKDNVIVTKLNKMDSKGGHMHQFGDLCDFTGDDFGDGPATFTQRGYSHQKFSSLPIEEDYLERTD